MFNFHRRKNTHDNMTASQHMVPGSVPMPVNNHSQNMTHSKSNSSPAIRNEPNMPNIISSSPITNNLDNQLSSSLNQIINEQQQNNVFGINPKKNSHRLTPDINKSFQPQYEADRQSPDDFDHYYLSSGYNRVPYSRGNNAPINRSSTRRVWVRKNARTATTIAVGPYDLVDDLKYMIAQKFPTTLAVNCDPSDLIIKLLVPGESNRMGHTVSNLSAPRKPVDSEGSNSPLSLNSGLPKPLQTINNDLSKTPISPQPVSHIKSLLLPSDHSQTDLSNLNNNTPSIKIMILEPDVVVWSVMDKYFPNGMSMSDALYIDINRSPAEESFPKYQSKPIRNEINFINPYDNSGVVLNHSKTAVIGDTRAPPPRLRSINNQDYSTGQTPQSSAVILFPKDIRGDSKSPVNHDLKFVPPPPSPKQNDEKLPPPIQLSKSMHHRTDSSEVRKKMNLKVNTDTSMEEPSVSKDNLISTDNFVSSATPNSEATITPQTNDKNTISTHGTGTASTITTKKKKDKKDKKDKKEKNLGISKILSHINVLVVEDNLVNQKIMARHLKSCNVQFQIASTGKEALEIWKKGGFHLCFMDIQLPVMSGIEVTKEIRRLERLNQIGNFSKSGTLPHMDENDELDLTLFRSPIIIVALTASSGATDQQNALAAGCNDFLTKPVQLKWLKNKLTEWGYMQALVNYDYFRSEI